MAGKGGSKLVSIDESTAGGAGEVSPRDRVFRAVMRGIYDGTLAPGERLTEAKLTEQFSVSRGPVREALNRLSANGVVELIPQRGAQIRVLSVEEAIDSLVVAQGLVGTAARLAAENFADTKGRKALTDAVAALLPFDQTTTSVDYAVARDVFYSTLTRLANNAALTRVMMQVHIHIIRAQYRAILGAVDRRRHRGYADIAAAVIEGDGRKAERTARAHLGAAINALQKFKAKQDGSAN